MKTICILCLLIFACSSPKDRTKINIQKEKINYLKSAKQTILAWNRFHNIEKTDSLFSVYADSVWFYGRQDMSKEQCVASKRQSLLKYKFYTQSIDSLNIRMRYQDSNQILVSLKKKVNADNNNYHYWAYFHLEWDKIANCYHIVQESDGTTDENLEIREVANKQIYEVGDYNGDGLKEKMWLRRGKNTAKLFLYSIIEFSDKKIPSIVLENCTGGVPRNEGDLDADSTDEISLVPSWISSDLTGMSVFFYQNQKWHKLIPSIPCRRYFLEQGHKGFDEKLYQKMVEKGDSTAKWVWVNAMSFDENLGIDVFIRKKQRIKMQVITPKRK